MNLKGIFLRFPWKAHYLGSERSKLKAAHPVYYFPGFSGKNIKNCPPSKLFLFTSLRGRPPIELRQIFQRGVGYFEPFFFFRNELIGARESHRSVYRVSFYCIRSVTLSGAEGVGLLIGLYLKVCSPFFFFFFFQNVIFCFV